MDAPDQLLCLFSARLDEQDGSYVVEVPAQKLDLGAVDAGQTYRVALLDAPASTAAPQEDAPRRKTARVRDVPTPPVEEGETRRVEIEAIGEQGDGIARVERGFVVIVPETTEGERVTVEITDVQPNVAFAEVADRHHHVE